MPGPDLSLSPRERCPCGANVLLRQARKPDRVCQECAARCGELRWDHRLQSWVCHVCRAPATVRKG
jgi:hypothetical protein